MAVSHLRVTVHRALAAVAVAVAEAAAEADKATLVMEDINTNLDAIHLASRFPCSITSTAIIFYVSDDTR